MAKERASDYLPAEVIDRPDFVYACRNRDLGAMLKIASKWGGPGFTPSHLARRCEMTVSRVQDYMQGRRQARSIHIFERIADGLHIPGQMLGMSHRPWEPGARGFNHTTHLQEPDQREVGVSASARLADHSPVPLPGVTELCRVLTQYNFHPSRSALLQHDGFPSLEDLERDLKFSFAAYQQSRFTMAASRVSLLLPDALVATQQCKMVEHPRASQILALSYQVAASVLTKAGQADLAWIAAERGLNAAETADSVSVKGSLIRSVAFAMLSVGHLEPTMGLVESGADCLRGEIAGNDVALSVYGTLLLVGSMAAARFGDASRAADYLLEASKAAQRLNMDANHLWTAFGPTNVAIHRVNTAAELGDIQTVLDCGLSLKTHTLPAERQVRYLLDVSRAYGLTRRWDDALRTILIAERIAPEQVHQHYLSRKILMDLMQRAPGRPAIALERLAKRMKVHELI